MEYVQYDDHQPYHAKIDDFSSKPQITNNREGLFSFPSDSAEKLYTLSAYRHTMGQVLQFINDLYDDMPVHSSLNINIFTQRIPLHSDLLYSGGLFSQRPVTPEHSFQVKNNANQKIVLYKTNEDLRYFKFICAFTILIQNNGKRFPNMNNPELNDAMMKYIKKNNLEDCYNAFKAYDYADSLNHIDYLNRHNQRHLTLPSDKYVEAPFKE